MNAKQCSYSSYFLKKLWRYEGEWIILNSWKITVEDWNREVTDNGNARKKNNGE